MTDTSANLSVFSPVNNAEHRPITTNGAQMNGGEAPSAAKNGVEDPHDETDIGPALYPPILENMEVLGYVKDKNGINYPRDIGRCTSIHSEMYFIFGDTVCKDAAGNIVGTVSNTIAYVDDRAKVLESEYREISDDGMVKAFVPLDEEETCFENEKENQGARIVFRMFGGAVDVGAVGVVWFQKLIVDANGEEHYQGVCQARLTTYSDGRIIVQRYLGLIFGPDEPRVGSFSALRYNGYVYLWSHRADEQIILARVGCLDTAFPERYTYWSASGWTPSWQNAQPVLHGVQHGAIVYTHMFGKDKPFLFVGVNNQEDSMVQIGAAADVRGPFNLIAICKATGIDHDEKYKYCIYPHLFASNVPKRELVISWSEHPPGGVIAARLKFKINEVAAREEAKERKRVAEEQEAVRLAQEALQLAELAETKEAYRLTQEAIRLAREAEESEADEVFVYED